MTPDDFRRAEAIVGALLDIWFVERAQLWLAAQGRFALHGGASWAVDCQPRGEWPIWTVTGETLREALAKAVLTVVERRRDLKESEVKR